MAPTRGLELDQGRRHWPVLRHISCHVAAAQDLLLPFTGSIRLFPPGADVTASPNPSLTSRCSYATPRRMTARLSCFGRPCWLRLRRRRARSRNWSGTDTCCVSSARGSTWVHRTRGSSGSAIYSDLFRRASLRPPVAARGSTGLRDLFSALGPEPSSDLGEGHGEDPFVGSVPPARRQPCRFGPLASGEGLPGTSASTSLGPLTERAVNARVEHRAVDRDDAARGHGQGEADLAVSAGGRRPRRGRLGHSWGVSTLLWVPRTRSRHATCRYSCTRPPSRSRRSGRTVAPEGGGVRPAGGC